MALLECFQHPGERELWNSVGDGVDSTGCEVGTGVGVTVGVGVGDGNGAGVAGGVEVVSAGGDAISVGCFSFVVVELVDVVGHRISPTEAESEENKQQNTIATTPNIKNFVLLELG